MNSDGALDTEFRAHVSPSPVAVKLRGFNFPCTLNISGFHDQTQRVAMAGEVLARSCC